MERGSLGRDGDAAAATRLASAGDAAAKDLGVIDGTYRIERELSRGGMGRVYVATHVHLGTRVAIKLLHDEDDDPPGRAAGDCDRARDDRGRFLQEARAAAQLRHPNVVQVLDFGVDRDRPYLVMELLEGETLRARMEREGALGAALTSAIVTGIAAALTAAHAAGIVHRDLKPDNVFLAAAADGGITVKVLDFGVAKVGPARSVAITMSGALLGTPAYMSPEQVQSARDVDPASDRWALGVIAYECLVGRRPFTAESLGELVLQIAAWSPPVPSQHGCVPDGFDAWFAIACARERADRFGSAADQAAALARIAGPQATPAPARAGDRPAPISEDVDAIADTVDETPSGGDAARALHELVPGDTMGRHQIVGVLGTGGMGRVYRARDPELDRELAIKVLRRASGDGLVDQQRLLREAQAMARLKHPNLTTVYDVGSVHGAIYIAFELIDGTTLAAWSRAPGRTTALRLAALIAAGRGLEAAHAAGVIHRDVKPDNVLVGHDGVVKVVDFGLARGIDGAADPAGSGGQGALAGDVTVTGALLGTPAYMGPEQHLGREADARADQFGFAVSAWEVLYGARPFRGATVGEVAAAICGGRVAPPPAGTDVPADVERILRRALRVEPAARYPAIGALLDALEATAAPSSPARRRRSTALAIVAGVAAAAVLGSALVLRRTGRRPAPAPAWHPRTVDVPPVLDENGGTIALSPDGTQLAFNSTRDGEVRVHVQSLTDGSVRALTPPGQPALDQRWTREGQAILWVTLKDGARRTPLDGGPTTVIAADALRVDDCGAGLVLATHTRARECDHQLSLRWLPPDGPERLLACLDTLVPVHDLRCSPDGKRVAFSWGPSPWAADLYLVDVAGGPVRPLTSGHRGDRHVTFHPDGRSVVFTSGPAGHSGLWEASLDGTVREQLTFGVGEDLSPQISPMGDALYYSLDDTAMFPFSMSADGTGRKRLRAEKATSVRFGSVDDSELFFSAGGDPYRQQLIARLLPDGSERVLGEGRQPWLTPDGELVYLRVDGTSNQILAMPRGGGASRLLTTVAGGVNDISGIAGGRVHYWSVGRDGALSRSVSLDGSGAVADDPPGWVGVAPSPSGWTAAGSLALHELHVFAPGVPVGGPARRVARARRYSWTPDGRTLFYLTDDAIWRYDPATDENRRLMDVSPAVEELVAGPGGQTLYIAEPVGQVRRQKVTNFGERPRLGGSAPDRAAGPAEVDAGEGVGDGKVIEATIRRLQPELAVCYDRAAAAGEVAAGTVMMRFEIGADGKVISTGIASDDFAGAGGVARCIAKLTLDWTFPAPAGHGLVRVKYPFHFEPDPSTGSPP